MKCIDSASTCPVHILVVPENFDRQVRVPGLDIGYRAEKSPIRGHWLGVVVFGDDSDVSDKFLN